MLSAGCCSRSSGLVELEQSILTAHSSYGIQWECHSANNTTAVEPSLGWAKRKCSKIKREILSPLLQLTQLWLKILQRSLGWSKAISAGLQQALQSRRGQFPLPDPKFLLFSSLYPACNASGCGRTAAQCGKALSSAPRAGTAGELLKFLKFRGSC